MNRKLRRQVGDKTKVKTYNLTDQQIEDIKNKAFTEALRKSTIIALYNSIMVLRDKGFGKKRLEDFTNDFFELLDSIQTNYLDFNDIINTIKDETGFEIVERD